MTLVKAKDEVYIDFCQIDPNSFVGNFV